VEEFDDILGYEGRDAAVAEAQARLEAGDDVYDVVNDLIKSGMDGEDAEDVVGEASINLDLNNSNDSWQKRMTEAEGCWFGNWGTVGDPENTSEEYHKDKGTAWDGSVEPSLPAKLGEADKKAKSQKDLQKKRKSDPAVDNFFHMLGVANGTEEPEEETIKRTKAKARGKTDEAVIYDGRRFREDVVKNSDGSYSNKGKSGKTHGKTTKEKAKKQCAAMYAGGFKG
jgi:hypothetical protein